MRLGYEPALDGLRGAAVLAVLLFHGEQLRGGYLGVDAFFVLSGYLITSLLLAEHRTRGAIALGAFWARRARRLLPALALVLLAVALYAARVAAPTELADIRADGLATLAYVANWHEIVAGADYFALFRRPSPLQHTWSLAIEEQFYVLWPLLVVALTRGCDAVGAARRVGVTAGVAAVASMVVAQLLYRDAGPPELTGSVWQQALQVAGERSISRVYYGTDTRIAAILVGAALAAATAVWGPVRGGRARALLEGAALLALAGLGAAWTRLPGDSWLLYRGGLLLCGLAVAVVIAAGVHPARGIVARLLSLAPLRWLGLISYGAYLWHWPIYVVIDTARTGWEGWWLLGLRLGVTLVVSVASYYALEQPIRHGAGSVRMMRVMVPATVVAVVAALFAGTAGAPTTAAAAMRGRGGILLVGDSVARTLAAGLVAHGYRVNDRAQPGCRLLLGDVVMAAQPLPACGWREHFRRAVRGQAPDVAVLLIGGWDLFDLRPPGRPEVLVPGTPAWEDYAAKALDEAVSILGAEGARVVLPTMPCVGRINGPGFGDAQSSYSVLRVHAWNAMLARVVAAHPGTVSSPDLFGFLCPHDRFENALYGVDPVRVDGVHFSDAGATLVARWLAPFIDDAAPRSRMFER